MLFNTKCVLILSTLFVCYIFILKRNQRVIIKVYVGFRVKVPLFFSDLGENWIFSECFEKSSYIKFNENPFGGIRVVLFGQMNGGTERQKNMIQVIVVFAVLYTRLNTDVG